MTVNPSSSATTPALLIPEPPPGCSHAQTPSLSFSSSTPETLPSSDPAPRRPLRRLRDGLRSGRRWVPQSGGRSFSSRSRRLWLDGRRSNRSTDTIRHPIPPPPRRAARRRRSSTGAHGARRCRTPAAPSTRRCRGRPGRGAARPRRSTSTCRCAGGNPHSFNRRCSFISGGLPGGAPDRHTSSASSNRPSAARRAPRAARHAASAALISLPGRMSLRQSALSTRSHSASLVEQFRAVDHRPDRRRAGNAILHRLLARTEIRPADRRPP